MIKNAIQAKLDELFRLIGSEQTEANIDAYKKLKSGLSSKGLAFKLGLNEAMLVELEEAL
jgi:hypothetical protein